MDRLEIVKVSTRTPSMTVSTGLHPVTIERDLQAGGTEGMLTTVVAASSARISLDRAAASQIHATRSRRSLWARVRPALATIEGLAASPTPARPPAAADAAGIAAAAAPEAPREPSGTTRVELTIDSLRSYDLVRPIPVVVESLGDRHYVAEVADLNISTSASSLSDILIILKDQVAQTYDGLRIKKNLDAEQTRQLKALETYIGKVRRGWLDRR
jgi:hypothetical protein